MSRAVKGVRVVLWGVVLLAVLGFAWLAVARTGYVPGPQALLSPSAPATTVASYGAPFEATLVGADGDRPVTREDLMGRPHAMFFGFTHCPDVCPTTLYETSQWLDALGPAAAGLDVYFVTVDPERDTAAVMRDYLRPFDARIRAITGTQEEIDRLVAGWNVYAKRVPLDGGGYNVDHTTATFLMRADGSLQGTIAYDETADVAVEKLRRLVKS